MEYVYLCSKMIYTMIFSVYYSQMCIAFGLVLLYIYIKWMYVQVILNLDLSELFFNLIVHI
jgi:hypothetical protein